MKRRYAVIAVVLVCCIMALCACGSTKKKRGSRNDDRDRGETTEAAVPTKDPADTDRNDPTVTPTPMIAFKPDVNVYDAVNIPLQGEEKVVNYKIPGVTISGVDTTAANDEIKRSLETEFTYELYEDIYYGSFLDYKYLVSDNMVILLIKAYDINYEGHDFRVFYVSVASGKLLSTREVLGNLGLNENEFMQKVRDTYQAWWDKTYKSMDDVEFMKQANIDNASLDNVWPFYDDNGHLMFVGHVEYPAGGGMGELLFDANTQNEAIDW